MPEEKGKKLNLDDRITIAARIEQEDSFASIARHLNVAPSTISREILLNRTDKGFRKGRNPNHCKHKDCFLKRVCGERLCTDFCSHCKKKNCNKYCECFEEIVCPKLKRPPYVCNICTKRFSCGLRRFSYSARAADQKAKRRRKDARRGIDADKFVLDPIIDQIVARLSRGQSPAHIWAALGDEIPFSERSFYRHIGAGAYGLNAFSLPRKVRYKQRKKKTDVFESSSFDGKRYADWLELDEEDRLHTVQIDCIKGVRHEREAILSLHFPLFHFQIYLPLAQETTAEINRAFGALELYCEGSFSQHFGIILADRGSGFPAWEILEYSSDEKALDKDEEPRRCVMYYCDPRRPEQKGAAEKNHVEFRRIVPKGSEIAQLKSVELSHIMSHVNSYSRKSLGGKTPYDLASQVLPKSLFEALGIVKIPSEKVMMTPELLKDLQV